jgi:hypothetical protein
MNNLFKLAIIRDFGSQTLAAKALGMHVSVLSTLVRDNRRPSAGELEKLGKHFSNYKLRKFFSKPKTTKIQGETVVNE